MCMKFCILISLVLVFIFGLYALCGDILWTVKVYEETVPSVFARLVREGYELPMTIVSVLLLSRVMGALAKKNWDFFSQLGKNGGQCLESAWLGALILSGVIVLAGRSCERYGVIDYVCSIVMTTNTLSVKGEWLVLSWAYRSLCLLNGALLLLMFIRSNRRLSILLMLIYFVLGLLLMMGSPPVVYLPNHML